MQVTRRDVTDRRVANGRYENQLFGSLLDTLDGRSILDQLKVEAQWWVPEHYFVEVASVLRPVPAAQATTAEVRAWAIVTGLDVSDRGQLRPEIWEAHHAAIIRGADRGEQCSGVRELDAQ